MGAMSGAPVLSPMLTYMCIGAYKVGGLLSVERRCLSKGSVRGDRPLGQGHACEVWSLGCLE